MKGQEVINEEARLIKIARDFKYEKEIQPIINTAHSKLLEIHARTLACHCECLGMNAENSWAVCLGKSPTYDNRRYNDVMKKWGLVNDELEPLI